MSRDLNIFQMTWYSKKHLRKKISSLVQSLLKIRLVLELLFGIFFSLIKRKLNLRKCRKCSGKVATKSLKLTQINMAENIKRRLRLRGSLKQGTLASFFFGCKQFPLAPLSIFWQILVHLSKNKTPTTGKFFIVLCLHRGRLAKLSRALGRPAKITRAFST